IINLVQNARDAMPEGGKLHIRCQTRHAGKGYRGADLNSHGLMGEGAYGVITLADTGRGMEPSVLARIFEPFFTTKPKAKRTGMGLSAAYGIVKQSGGTITAESIPGRGSRFEVWIPATATGDDVSPLEQKPAEWAQGKEESP